ncbi:MAG: DNA/RNA non-specific endonuclease [Cyanobacteria bacterium P01_F01_bin.42]
MALISAARLSISGIWGSLLISALAAGCNVFKTEATDHLRFGNPSQASANVKNDTNYLITKPQFALSYSRDLGRANWVSWELNSRWMGDAERQNDFRPDSGLPPDWDAVTPRDYRRSGYDRGHLVPSADRTRSEEDNSATFVMTNVIPQRPHNNQGPWRELEKDCRDWVEAGKTLQIIAGGYGKQAQIGKNTLTPPSRVWKAILILEPGSEPDDVNEDTIVVAVDMPNRQGIRDDNWTKYQVSVDHIEEKAGLNLFSLVSADVQKAIEARVDRDYPKER